MTMPAAEPTMARDIMKKLFGHNVYEGFAPSLEEDLQGWNSYAPVFARLFNELRPRVVVDVGVWKGASTIHLAGMLRDAGIDGAVIGIDVFLGNFDPPYHATIKRRNGLALLYEQFLSNIAHRKLQDYIVPMPYISVFAGRTLRRLEVFADVVHVDAAHEYVFVLEDLKAFWPILRSGGYLIADDYGPAWPGVKKAVDEFAAGLGIPVIVESPKAIMRKP